MICPDCSSPLLEAYETTPPRHVFRCTNPSCGEDFLPTLTRAPQDIREIYEELSRLSDRLDALEAKA